MPEQENLEEQAKQDNEKLIKKERRNMNINMNSHGQEKNINLEEKKELRILIAGTSLCQHVPWVYLVTVNFAENLSSDNVMIYVKQCE